MYTDEFETDLKKVMSLGYDKFQSGCYLMNYYDKYICEQYNGGCKHKDICKEINKKIIKEIIIGVNL